MLKLLTLTATVAVLQVWRYEYEVKKILLDSRFKYTFTTSYLQFGFGFFCGSMCRFIYYTCLFCALQATWQFLDLLPG